MTACQEEGGTGVNDVAGDRQRRMRRAGGADSALTGAFTRRDRSRLLWRVLDAELPSRDSSLRCHLGERLGGFGAATFSVATFGGYKFQLQVNSKTT
jgi:hypothetical protein